MSVIFVQFKDATESEVVGVFGCPQPEKHYPFQGEVSEDDPRYQAYLMAWTVQDIAPSDEQTERAWRDGELSSVVWLRDRHRDQLELSTDTTLTAEQFNELLVFMQALRDWPQSEQFPVIEYRPVTPPWIAEQNQ